MQLGVYLYFEIFCLLVAIYCYIQKRNKLLLYFIPFLLLTVTVELIGPVLFANGYKNYWMYNLFTTFEFLFYSFLFYIHSKKQGIKKLILLFIPIFSLVVLLNLLFIQGFNKTFHTYTFLLGSFFIVIFCCLFFYESVLPDKIDQQLSNQPFFWIASGLLIFYLGSVIINALFEFLRSNDLGDEGRRIYRIINTTLNIFLYSSFCIAFFLCRNNKKISS